MISLSTLDSYGVYIDNARNFLKIVGPTITLYWVKLVAASNKIQQTVRNVQVHPYAFHTFLMYFVSGSHEGQNYNYITNKDGYDKILYHY